MPSISALYKGIEESWNSNFASAKRIMTHFESKGDFRHSLHKIELSIFKVLITGKKSLIDKCMVKILRFEQQLSNLKQQGFHLTQEEHTA